MSVETIDRRALIERFSENRRRTRELFELIEPGVYFERPIPLRQPVVFYEGHIAAFNVNTLLKRGLGQPGIDERLERLFARGIDPESPEAAERHARASWPAREDVRRYVEAADRAVLDALAGAPIDQPGHPLLDRAEAVHTILEHESMHQETLLYMWHRLPYACKRRRADAALRPDGDPPPPAAVRIPAGRATLGADPDRTPFGWDNEFPQHTIEVPAFDIDVHDVSNQDYLAFMDAGGYESPDLWTPEGWRWRVTEQVEHPLFWERQDGGWVWRGLFEAVPLPAAWPVYVTHAEATAYARWAGKRLPSEAEYHRAAYGTPSGVEGRHPWGEAPPDPSRGNFGFQRWDPVPVGSYPAGASAWGVHDLAGNGWEWTSTVFSGFPGFRPMASYPEYSADFFDGRHYVIKGASPVTATDLVRRSFRNWFRPEYPYVYATFRCATDA